MSATRRASWGAAVLLFVSACALGPRGHEEYRPNPPVAASQRTALGVAVIELENWNPPDDPLPEGALILMPGVLWESTGTRYDETGVGRCLYVDLVASRAFGRVDYLAEWPDDPAGLEEYDFLVTGRLLGDGVSMTRSLWGLNILGAILSLAGAPTWKETRSLEFELAAIPARAPSAPLTERVRLPEASTWGNSYVYDQRTKQEPAIHFEPCPTEQLQPVFADFRDAMIGMAAEGER